MKKKKAYNSVSDSDDFTSGSDNNCAVLQHNKRRIAVKSDEEENISGEELKTEHISGVARISMVKNLKQMSMHVTEMILNGTHGAELKKKNSTPLKQ